MRDRLVIRKRSPSTVNTKETAHMHHASRAASRELILAEPRFGLLLAAPGVMVAPLFVSPSLKTNSDILCDPTHPRMIFRHLFQAECGPRRTRLSRHLGEQVTGLVLQRLAEGLILQQATVSQASGFSSSYHSSSGHT